MRGVPKRRKKGRAPFLLDLMNLQAERRMFEADPFGCTGEMQLLCDRDEIDWPGTPRREPARTSNDPSSRCPHSGYDKPMR